MNRAYSLAEVVEAGWAPSEHYLIVRLRRKEIRGKKIGRHWAMSEEDVRAYIESRSNDVQPAVEVPRFGLTAASARRRAS